MPLSVKLQACIFLLGHQGPVQWDHDPALELRKYDPETGKWDPDANDPRYIVPRSIEDHAIKTNGSATPLSGDKSKIAKLKRVEEKAAAFRARLLAKAPDAPRAASKWPSRKFPGKSRKLPAKKRGKHQ